MINGSIEALREGLRSAPGDADLHRGLAEAYTAIGETRLAEYHRRYGGSR